jgi:hypothetical protein
VLEFLSAPWIERLDAAVRDADDLAVEPGLVIETLVRGPAGDSGYQVRFAPGGASVRSAGDAPADVVLLTDASTAWALHRGSERAQDAFARGALKVRGRPELLAEHGALLAALARALTPVRGDTRPPPGVPDGR